MVGLALLFVSGCGKKEKAGRKTHEELVSRVPQTARTAGSGKFVKLSSAESGLTFTNSIEADHELSRLYHGGFGMGAVAVGDVDGDGMPDLFCVGGAQVSRLFKQVAPLKFEDVSKKAGFNSASSGWAISSSMVDIDNDSDLDIYVCYYNTPNELWVNDGNGQFSESANEYGVDFSGASVMAYFGDFNNDRFIDMYLLTNRLYHPDGLVKDFNVQSLPSGQQVIEPRLEEYFKLAPNAKGEMAIAPRAQADRLFQNEGGRKFKDVSSSSGIHGDGHGTSAIVWDYDGDNDLDIYVCNDFNDPDCLLENNGDGRFENRIEEVFNQTGWLTKGSDFADVNNDGLMDFCTVGKSPGDQSEWQTFNRQLTANQHLIDAKKPDQTMKNRLYFSGGNTFFAETRTDETRFVEVAEFAQVARAGWAWSPILGDFDCDGFCDMFISTGHIRDFGNLEVLNRTGLAENVKTEWDFFRNESPVQSPNRMFKNSNGINFKPIANEWGLDAETISLAAAPTDLDRDGDLDLVVVNVDDTVSVYRNEVANGNSLTVELAGQYSNRSAVGAKVRIEIGTRKQQQQVSPQRGFLTSRECVLHFGIGTRETVDRVVIKWPNGNEQVLEDVAANQILKIEEPDRVPPFENESTTQMFGQLINISIQPRAEKEVDEYAVQPLLPRKRSKAGPGIAAADLSGNKMDDLYVASPAWQSKAICARNRSSDEQQIFFKVTPFEGDFGREEISPLFFDMDGDADFDLFIVDGGVEYGQRVDRVRSTIMINMQSGGFRYAVDTAIPKNQQPGSVAVAADYDRDGDLDVFVGNAGVTGKYPESGASWLFRNETTTVDDPRFVEATASDAPELAQAGLVTSALWSDIDNDSWIDLLVTTHLGPVRVFKNYEGVLKEATQECGLAGYIGFWNGIIGGDIDNDGDFDYVATNHGFNSRYNAFQSTSLHYGTFGAESRDRSFIVESFGTPSGEYPFRSKSALEKAFPFLESKFPTDAAFGSLKLNEVFGDAAVSEATKFEINELGTCLLVNDGTGKFERKQLPWLAQAAPAFGGVISDFNADGLPDIFLAQNDFSLNPELGRQGGGLGAMLLGVKGNGFKSVWPFDSGVSITKDAKSVLVSDLNLDRRPDLIVGINNDRALFYRNLNEDNEAVCVELKSRKGNRFGIGARVQLFTEDGKVQTREVSAGGGYLSQSTNRQFFSIPASTKFQAIRVYWPDGTKSDHTPSSRRLREIVVVEKPRN